MKIIHHRQYTGRSFRTMWLFRKAGEGGLIEKRTEVGTRHTPASTRYFVREAKQRNNVSLGFLEGDESQGRRTNRAIAFLQVSGLYASLDQPPAGLARPRRQRRHIVHSIWRGYALAHIETMNKGKHVLKWRQPHDGNFVRFIDRRSKYCLMYRAVCFITGIRIPNNTHVRAHVSGVA